MKFQRWFNDLATTFSNENNGCRVKSWKKNNIVRVATTEIMKNEESTGSITMHENTSLTQQYEYRNSQSAMLNR